MVYHFYVIEANKFSRWLASENSRLTRFHNKISLDDQLLAGIEKELSAMTSDYREQNSKLIILQSKYAQILSKSYTNDDEVTKQLTTDWENLTQNKEHLQTCVMLTRSLLNDEIHLENWLKTKIELLDSCALAPDLNILEGQTKIIKVGIGNYS